MKRFLIALISIFILISCEGLIPVYHYFIFKNNSSKHVYVLIDIDTQDDSIIGSECWPISPNRICYISSKTRWEKIIRDFAYIYVVDASKIKLPAVPLSQENLEKITNDMILDTIILHISDLNEPVCYPSE